MILVVYCLYILYRDTNLPLPFNLWFWLTPHLSSDTPPITIWLKYNAGCETAGWSVTERPLNLEGQVNLFPRGESWPTGDSHCFRSWWASTANTDKPLSSRGLWTQFPICFSLSLDHSFPFWLALPLQGLCSNAISEGALPSLTNLFKVESCSRWSAILFLIFLFFTIFITT